MREGQVRVEKRPEVAEDLLIGKRVVRETERVADTVPREEVIETGGDTDIDRELDAGERWKEERGWLRIRNASA